MPKQYRTAQPCYLRLKGAGAGDPVFIEGDVLVGEDTPFDFEGPPSIGMVPITDSAVEAHEEMMQGAAGGPPTVKDDPKPAEGGATPFDPASGKKDSDIEKDPAKADPKKSFDAQNLKK